MHSRHIAVVLTIAACGGGGSIAHEAAPHDATSSRFAANGTTQGDADRSGPAVPYDRTIQKSIHNAFERKEPLLDQLVYHRARSLELDIHVARQGIAAPPGEWFVFHEDNPFMERTSCSQLSDCLGLLAAFHRAVPRHEVVTLFVDLKDDFSSGHKPSDLDDALTRAIGRDAILTPADLMAACPGAASPRAAVTSGCSFPTLRALRGKFIVATTGGTACNADSHVARYGGAWPRDRLAFMAPNVDASCPVSAHAARPDVVFFNMTASERARATEVRALGLVPRVYGGLDDPNGFAAARAAGAVHLATDRVNFERDGWSKTHQPSGFPFACRGCDDAVGEDSAVVGVRAASGDQWGAADSGFFALTTESTDTTWQALVSVPSSHVESFAKACLVARASEAPDAPSVAVCRPFDANPPRVQIRAKRGGPTTSIEARAVDGLTPETAAFVRLSMQRNVAVASVSVDGETWTTIGSAAMTAPLPVRGISVSSKGGAKVKALFTNLSRGPNAETLMRVRAASLDAKAIGAGARGDVFDGVFAP